jgi:amicyanin
MKKSTLGIIIAVVAVLALGGVIVANQSNKSSQGNGSGNMDMSDNTSSNKDNSAEMDLTNQTEVSMDIRDYKYEKPNIKIKKGTTVTWTNQDSVMHNVILDGLNGPIGANEVKADMLSGPLLAKGESYSFTFNEVTPNGYYCSPHPYMKGVVNVIDK